MASRRLALLAAVVITATGATVTASSSVAEEAAQPTTAWRDGGLRVDTEGVVSRSDLVLEQPSWRRHESMPLGNGTLGAAVWAENGFSAQLNRADTFPRLQSAGRLEIPGLFPLVSADDYRGRVRLYDAELRQSGNGMAVRAYVRADRDQLVVEVTGADPGQTQHADFMLWPGRTPTTYATGDVAALAETITDDSGATTGTLAAMTARARDVRATVVDDLTVRLRFQPHADGSFRIVVAAPAYRGGDVGEASRRAVAGAKRDGIDREHLAWWHRYWRTAAPMRITSPDGAGEYLESLRAQHLYVAAATQRSSVPSGQAGAVRILYPWEDKALSPDYWFHFNLRQQVYANFGAGTEELNVPYLRLYEERLDQMRQWTRDHWPNTEGVCVPELFRYDGTGAACDGTADPDWLNRIVSSGAEVAHNIWLQYRYTGDSSVLDDGYPLMRDVARFYLSLLREGADGRLHLEHLNSLETQWDATDPTPDVAGMTVMFPIIARLAEQRGDGALVGRLREAASKLPALPTDTRRGEEVLAWSGTDATDESAKNTQNADLEPVYPWGLLGADSELARATFHKRVFPLTREWDESPIWAARLGLSDAMKDLLIKGTADLQKHPNGFTGHGKNDDPARIQNYYATWSAVVAGALQDALVQSYQGVVEVASAWPEDWDVDGSVQVQGGHRVSTQVREGTPNHVGIQAATTETLRVANPWPGEEIQVVDGTGGGEPVVGPTTADVVQVPVERGHSYLLERTSHPYAGYDFRPVDGEPAAAAKHLGGQTLGVAGSTPQIDSDLVTVVEPRKLRALVRAEAGVDHYVDRGDVIEELPAALDGSILIRGAAEDDESTGPADYLTFDLARPSTVYVAFDKRGEGTWWPNWLREQGWTRTDMTVQPREYARSLAIVDGRLRASGGGVTLTHDGASWGDQVIETTVQQIQVGASVMFRAPDRDNGYVWQIGSSLGDGLGYLRLHTMVDGRRTQLAAIPLDPAPANEYELRIEAIGDRIQTFVDGELVDDRRLDLFDRGRVGFRMGGADIGEFNDIRVTSPDGTVLFEDDFTGGLDAWEIPADRHDVPLVVFEKQLPAGRVSLGPNSGVEDEGDASYLTFVAEARGASR